MAVPLGGEILWTQTSEISRFACCCRGEAKQDILAWEPHILANTPFYFVLLPLFLDLLATRVSTRGDAALQDLIRVGVLPLLAASHSTGGAISCHRF